MSNKTSAIALLLTNLSTSVVNLTCLFDTFMDKINLLK